VDRRAFHVEAAVEWQAINEVNRVDLVRLLEGRLEGGDLLAQQK
jgi:hypothetical protein